MGWWPGGCAASWWPEGSMLRFLLTKLLMLFLSRAPTFSFCARNSVAVPLNVRHRGSARERAPLLPMLVPPCYCDRVGHGCRPSAPEQRG